MLHIFLLPLIHSPVIMLLDRNQSFTVFQIQIYGLGSAGRLPLLDETIWSLQ